MKSKDNNLDLDEWKDTFSQHLIEVIFKCLLEEERERGVAFSQEIAITFLTRFLGGIIYNTLEHKPMGFSKSNGKEQYEYTSKQYAHMKHQIENAVAAGFQGAMTTYSKMPVDFYCQVKTVPEPTNKMVN